SLHLCSKDYGYFHICLDKHLPYILQYKSPGSYINFPAICSNSITLVHYSQSSLLVIFLILILDRKSTRLNSSHVSISYAVFCYSLTIREIRRFPTRRSSDLFVALVQQGLWILSYLSR